MELCYKPDLNGKVAVITGGAGVLCREFAKALAPLRELRACIDYEF